MFRTFLAVFFPFCFQRCTLLPNPLNLAITKAISLMIMSATTDGLSV